MASSFQISGRNAAAPFTLKLHRGDGMLLLGMNWRRGKPPTDFVGFAIEYREPGGERFFALKNRLAFPGDDGSTNPNKFSTRLSPIQKFRWVHFPRNAELAGAFTYRVTPVFMNAQDELSYGEPQEASIELRRETHPGKLNLAFTRGFVSSQAFVEQYQDAGAIDTLLPRRADDGLTFTPTHRRAAEALAWMGFEARSVILELLDAAIADERARVRVVAYDLSEPEVVARLERLGARLSVIIDDSEPHAKAGSAESQAARRLAVSAGSANVRRQHMGNLQHNKTIVVDGRRVQAVVCGSTNFSWRGLYVQANNAVVLRGSRAVRAFSAAFDDYWANDRVADFGSTASARLANVGVAGIDAQVGFAPFTGRNVLLQTIADDVAQTTSSLFFSLAFLYQTRGPIRQSITAVTRDPRRFVYGISDKDVGGIDVQQPDGRRSVVRPEALTRNVPEPFRSEPTAGGGIRMHHKFIVIDFDKPTARVYMGSYNFSKAADTTNGENVLVIRDRRVAVSYAVEAVRLFDHYHFRVVQAEATAARTRLALSRPPRRPGERAWWAKHWADERRIRDRELFA